MDTKWTRRAVLGTVIGGLAVTPFVMWSLKRRKEITGGFIEEWRQAVSSFHVEIEPLTSERIDFSDPLVPVRESNFFSMFASYHDSDFPKTFPVSSSDLVLAIPAHFIYRAGSFTFVPECNPISLSGNTVTDRFVFPGGEQNRKVGKWDIDLKMLQSGNVPQEKKELIPLGSCVELSGGVALTPGNSWKGANPFFNMGDSLLDFTVNALVSINGSRSVRADFCTAVNDHSALLGDVDRQRMIGRFLQKGYSQVDAESIADTLAKELTVELSKKAKTTIEGSVYLDLKTGQVIRHCVHVTTSVSSGIQHGLGLYQIQC
ncbi:hypothetical protein FACS1894170_02940 [Planctomycetales bacterium]|nr:hypothetical protein FACS1894170_02940 [Planctomycetales bacterium]